MAYDPKILHRATARLAQQKQFREARREALRERLYAQEPRLAQLDRQLQGTMADLVAASLRRGQRDGQQRGIAPGAHAWGAADCACRRSAMRLTARSMSAAARR